MVALYQQGMGMKGIEDPFTILYSMPIVCKMLK